ncbi:MAG: DMT family transporter [Gammaproteobacteria bacterium]|nr:DMT family transporter [Gammaproteobacteria bacterium]
MPRAAGFGDWISLLALTLLWGSAFMFNELALASFPPAVLVSGRIVIATLLIYGYLRMSGKTLPGPGRAWLPMVVMAVFANVLPFHLIAWAQQHIDSSLAGILMAVMPLFVLTLAHFFVPGARLTPFRVAGFVIGFAGVVVVIGPGYVQGLDGNMAFWGALAALGAALSYSVSTVYARRLGPGDPLRRSAGMLIVASVLSAPAALLDLSTVTKPGIGAVVALVVLGLLATGFATLLYFRLVQGPGPTFISLVNYLLPAWAVIAGAVFLDESLSSSLYAGLFLILAGIGISELGTRIVDGLKIIWLRVAPSSVPVAVGKDA